MGRRIVTGIDENGKSIFESDDTPAFSFSIEEDWPGFNNVELSQTAKKKHFIHMIRLFKKAIYMRGIIEVTLIVSLRVL